tara:strand:- start:15457 stop:16446 length:990 start_codon:yes stop_codon:yes gene_type:complete
MATASGNSSNTLSVNELVADVLDSYKVQFPVISNFARDFSSDSARRGQTITARVLSSIASPSDYDASAGYEGSTTDVGTLTNDINITLDQHKYVSISMDYLDMISTQRDLYGEVASTLAHTLGKGLMSAIWDGIVSANFTESVAGGATASGVTLSTLHDLREKLNTQGASVAGRYGIVNSKVMTGLLTDEKIASGDYYGQLSGANGIGILRNIAGFEAIYEYPSADGNSENCAGFFGDRNAINIASRVPNDFQAQASRANAPAIASNSIVQDADTGMPMMALSYQKAGTFDIVATLTHIYGLRFGCGGGTDGTLTDNSGVRLTVTDETA